MAFWDIEWLAAEDDNGVQTVPAFKFLKGLPNGPRQFLLDIVESVRHTGPDKWLDGTHKAMYGVCAHLHEARDRQDQDLHRLFLYWQRDENRVVIIDGRTKPNGTALPDEEYKKISERSRLAEGDDPSFATFDDFARMDLAPTKPPDEEAA